MSKKWKYKGSAQKNVFGQPMHIGSHWLEDESGFRHIAVPIHKTSGKDKSGRYKFKQVGWDVGKYGRLKPSQVTGYKNRR